MTMTMTITNNNEFGQSMTNNNELGQLAKDILRNECYRRSEEVNKKIIKLENQLSLLHAKNAELARVLKLASV